MNNISSVAPHEPKQRKLLSRVSPVEGHSQTTAAVVDAKRDRHRTVDDTHCHAVHAGDGAITGGACVAVLCFGVALGFRRITRKFEE